jgi:hypothetical protein
VKVGEGGPACGDEFRLVGVIVLVEIASDLKERGLGMAGEGRPVQSEGGDEHGPNPPAASTRGMPTTRSSHTPKGKFVETDTP